MASGIFWERNGSPSPSRSHQAGEAGNTKLSGAANTLGGREAIQRDLDRLEKRDHENIMRFNEAKSRVLHRGWGYPTYLTEWGKISFIAALWRRTWESWQTRSWTWASSVRLQPGRPTITWAALKEEWPAGRGRWLSPSTRLLWGPIWRTASRPGASSTRRTESS